MSGWKLATLVLNAGAIVLCALVFINAADANWRRVSWVAYALLIAGWTCGEIWRSKLRARLPITALNDDLARARSRRQR